MKGRSIPQNFVRVGIFEAGYPGASVRRVRQLLRSGKHRYRFEAGGRIHNLGNPDLMGYGYSDRAFLKALGAHIDDYQICILLTSVPIEGNFYTRDIEQRLIVCTSHQANEFIQRSDRTIEEYFALSVCPELLSIEFQRTTGRPWEDLFHQDVRGCPFDFAGVKSQLTAYLTGVTLCETCRGVLAESNVNNLARDYIETFLSEIRRPSFVKALRMCITSPGLSFAFGGIVLGLVINVFSSLVIADSPPSTAQFRVLQVLLCIAIAFPVSVYGWTWIQYFRKTKRVAV